ncbi:MAG TPA: SagB family peptide dehydrogenase [Candidatus Limnocylindria bacterium]|nr:SagB family peptide dehydrogenase [Candidatus Limnocylindria bacterium]
MRRLRQDVDWLVSAGLLVSATATAVTGIVADVWDLNDFWYHTVAGYVMGGFAMAHVALNWGRLTSYARFRLRPNRQFASRAPSVRDQTPEPVAPGALVSRMALSRRGLLGMAIGGIGGWLVGRGLRPRPQIAAGADVGVVYHEWSKPGVIDALGTVASWGQFPELYKRYPDAPRVALPDPRLEDGPPTASTIAARRSTRTYAPTPTTLQELGDLLFLTTGISADRWGNARRTAPSSGALYPIETYAVVHNVAGLERGVYHYAVREHELELLRAGDHRARVVDQGLGQEFLGECGAVLFLTQILQRMRPKYQDRSYRYGLLEAGHIGENGYLAAVSLGLGACGVGAFMDDDMNAMLGVDGVEEAAVYMLAVGHAA